MQKIFKKSLALAVSAALCLTAFIGCLSVNAEGATPSYVVETKEGTPGEKVLINVKGTDLTAICGQSVDVVVAAGLDVTRVLEADKTTEMLPISTEDGGDYNKVVSDEGTTLKFVDIINFNDEITTANFEFNIEAVIPADAAVGTVYGVTLDGQFADLGEEWVTTNVTNGSVTVIDNTPVEPEYFTYTGATYDIVKSELTINRSAPSDEMRAVLSEANAAGNRKVQLVVDVDGTEFLFPASITAGAGSFKASGFALTHMNANISIYIRVTANGDYLFNSNAYDVILADVVEQMANDGNAKAVSLVELNRTWAATEEIIAIEDAMIENGAVDYTSVAYDAKKSEISVGRDVPSNELKTILSEGNKNGNRSVKLVVDVNGTEFLFNASITAGAGTFKASGFALPHFTQDVKIYIRVTSGANSEYVVNTNAVTVNLHQVMQSAENSDFANAYNSYYNVQ